MTSYRVVVGQADGGLEFRSEIWGEIFARHGLVWRLNKDGLSVDSDNLDALCEVIHSYLDQLPIEVWPPGSFGLADGLCWGIFIPGPTYESSSIPPVQYAIVTDEGGGNYDFRSSYWQGIFAAAAIKLEWQEGGYYRVEAVEWSRLVDLIQATLGNVCFEVWPPGSFATISDPISILVLPHDSGRYATPGE